MNDKVYWGSQFLSSVPHHKWFKLELDPERRREALGTSATLLDATVSAFEKSVSTEKKVIDFLTFLREHAESVLKERIGKTAISTTPIDYVLTIPAIWSESAQAKTRSCAEKAGMGPGGSLQLISEPEAAAIYAIKTTKHTNWKVKDRFVLVDAGGGTVDLISYIITQLEPTIQLTEVTVGSGKFCGSAFIDTFFRRKLEGLLGDDPNCDEEILDEVPQFSSINLLTS